MCHEDEEEDDDNNSTNNNDDDDNSGDHVPQQQHTITCDNPRTREGRGRKTRGQQSPANPIQQDERPWHISRRTCCGTSSHY